MIDLHTHKDFRAIFDLLKTGNNVNIELAKIIYNGLLPQYNFNPCDIKPIIYEYGKKRNIRVLDNTVIDNFLQVKIQLFDGVDPDSLLLTGVAANKLYPVSSKRYPDRRRPQTWNFELTFQFEF